MLLTLDIGNTNITIGLFNGEEIVDIKRMPTDIHYSNDRYEQLLFDTVGDINIKGCIIASVVNGLDMLMYNVVNSIYNIDSIILSTNLDTGIKLKLKDNNEIGADRIANGIAAAKLYKLPVIVVDFGTANTFDIVNSKGEFIGGVIAPGINTQLTSLSKCTSKLPKLDAAKSENAIGDNTLDAILSGVIRGTACMVDGLIEQCENELGENATIVATGGLCRLIAKYMNREFDDINPTLTLLGLKELYKLNQNQEHLLHQYL